MIPDTETKGSLCFLGDLASLFPLPSSIYFLFRIARCISRSSSRSRMVSRLS